MLLERAHGVACHKAALASGRHRQLNLNSQRSQSEFQAQLSNQVGRLIATSFNTLPGTKPEVSGPNGGAYRIPWCIASGLS